MADELGVSQSVISRLALRFRDTESVGERPISGAPRGTTRNDYQYLRTYALRNRDLTAPVLQSRPREVRGTRVSRQTIRNRLHHFGLRARRPLQVTPLTDRHRGRLCYSLMNPGSPFTEMMAVNAAGGVEVSEMPLSMWFPDTDMEGVV